MPHSSGGGSHGGGFHGGGSHGSSGNRISNHYYPGARRYVRHHRNTGVDEYVYARSKPQRANLSAVIIIIVMGVFFVGMTAASIHQDKPRRLNGLYDTPAVHDDANVIKDDDALTETINDYYVLTGICPVVYTVYDEDWDSSRNPNLMHSYADLESLAYFKYTDNFPDEKHFVIVYSVPKESQRLYEQGKIDVPDYSWEAVQGDDTDPIITESMFRRFGNIVQDDLEKGLNPGVAFDDAFKYALENAESKLNPSFGAGILKTISSCIPLLFVSGIFVPMIIMAIKSYKKDRDVEYEEVPLDSDDLVSGTNLGSASVGGYAATSSGYSGSFSESPSKVSKAGSIFGLIFLIPFLIVGVGITVAGLVTFRSSGGGFSGIYFIVFGIIWSAISFYTFFKMVKSLIKGNKKADVTPLTAEYPKAEYPKAEYPDVSSTSQAGQPFKPFQASQPSEPEFDPAFFQPAKSNIEDDDEDYKRMKRKGYE